MVADVIATRKIFHPFVITWQMLLPYDIVVDVKTTSCMLQQLFGRCYLPSGRWNSHSRVDVHGRCLYQLADGTAKDLLI